MAFQLAEFLKSFPVMVCDWLVIRPVNLLAAQAVDAISVGDQAVSSTGSRQRTDSPGGHRWLRPPVGAAEKAVRIMGFPYSGVDGHELFLSRCRNAGLASIPVCLAVVGFLFAEEGWHFSFLVCCVLPPIAAYLGVRGKREIRTGMSATALGIAIVTLPLMLALASLEIS